MRRIERIDLIDRVGRELQARMSYSDIDVYLKHCGIDVSKETSNVNSKWIYVKELLADEPDEKIIEIADELEVKHGYSARRDVGAADMRFWLPGHFRLFLSHVSIIKVKTAQLQKALRKYGISGFVAHEDIEPTKEWQNEIEKALMSMDALLAVLSPGFKESNWTDQEVGVAVGRDVLVVPIRKGLDPYGFIAKYQGYSGDGKTIGDVAEAVFKILVSNAKTKGKMGDVLTGLILLAKSEERAKHLLGLLQAIPGLPRRHVERLQANAGENEVLLNSEESLKELNLLLKDHGLDEVAPRRASSGEFDDDIPF